MNEELQTALSSLEEKFCDCRRLTTSDLFWLGDHRPDCAIVKAVTWKPEQQQQPYIPGTAWNWNSQPGFDKNKNRRRR